LKAPKLKQSKGGFRPKFYILVMWWRLYITLLPKIAKGYFHLGNTYMAQGIIDKAIKYWEISVSLDSTFRLAWHNLASTWMTKKSWQKASNAYAELNILQPGNSEYYICFGYCLEMQSQKNDAIEAYEQGIRVQPDTIKGRYSLATLHFRNKSFEKAEEQLNLLLQQKENHVGALEHLGKIYLKKKKYDNAESAFLTALEHTTNCDPLFYLLGLTLEHKGSNDKARRWYQKVSSKSLSQLVDKRLEKITKTNV
jgi:tetratricopeptide (TPR) repeat protein